MQAKKITSLQHPLVLHWAKLVKDKTYRQREKSVLVTGKTLVRELFQKNCLKSLITVEESDLKEKASYLVTEEILKKITSLSSTDGWAAEITMPEPVEVKDFPYILVLDEINDPGNLGTLIRSAYALKWSAVVITPGSVDLFNDKALRSAKGATFSLPYKIATREEIALYPHQKIVADMNGVALNKISIAPPIALILSNEARGAKDWNKSTFVKIPMQEDAESLNVASAGAILLYAMRNT